MICIPLSSREKVALVQIVATLSVYTKLVFALVQLNITSKCTTLGACISAAN